LARKYHPDLNPNDKQAEIKFKELNEGTVLSNLNRKNTINGENWEQGAEYEKARKQQSQYQGSQQQTSFNGFEGDDYSDFFESMFAGQGGRARTAIKDKILTLNYI
jgi:curved DNA-binding protein